MIQYRDTPKPELRSAIGQSLAFHPGRLYLYSAEIKNDTNEPISSPRLRFGGKSVQTQKRSYRTPNPSKNTMHTNEPISSPFLLEPIFATKHPIATTKLPISLIPLETPTAVDAHGIS